MLRRICIFANICNTIRREQYSILRAFSHDTDVLVANNDGYIVEDGRKYKFSFLRICPYKHL